MRRLGLDRVWWLVTPAIRSRIPTAWRRSPSGSPPRGPCASSPHRRDRLRSRTRHQLHLRDDLAIWSADVRASISSGSWVPTICAASIAGSAGATSRALVPIAVVDRLGPSLYATASAAGQALARFRLPESAARTLPERRPPAWIYLHGLKSPLSSTALRAARALQRRLKLLTWHAYLRVSPGSVTRDGEGAKG